MIWQLALLQIFFFVGLVFALQKLFHGNLIKAINRLEVLRKRNQQKEEELNASQILLVQERTEKLKAVETEIQLMRKNAENEIQHLKQIATSHLEEEKKVLRQEFEQREKSFEIRTREKARSETTVVSNELVKRGFTLKMRERLHGELCAELIEGLSSALPKKLTVDAIHIRTAFALSPVEKKSIQIKVLPALTNANVAQELPIRETVESDLVAGFILSLGDYRMDGSLKNRFEKEIQHVKFDSI